MYIQLYLNYQMVLDKEEYYLRKEPSSVCLDELIDRLKRYNVGFNGNGQLINHLHDLSR